MGSLIETPDFVVNVQEISIKAPESDPLQFVFPLTGNKITEITPTTMTWQFQSAKLSPSKARVNAFADGIELYFEKGFALRFQTISPPYLSWAEGSVGESVPAAPSKFILVSHRSNQPPLLLTFPEGPQTLKVDGRPGQWSLRCASTTPFWVRFIAPNGLQPWPATQASDLGEQLKAFSPHLTRWTEPPVKLVSIQAENTPKGLKGTFKLSGPGAALPLRLAEAFRAKPRGMKAEAEVGMDIRTKARWFKGDSYTILFPPLAPVVGRAATATVPALKRIEYKNAKDVVNLALKNMASTRSVAIREQAMNELNAFATLLPAGWNSNTRVATERTMAAYVLLGQVVAPGRRAAWTQALSAAVNPVTGNLQTRNLDPTANDIAALALGLSDDARHQFLGALLDALGSSSAEPKRALSPFLEDLYGKKLGNTLVRQPIRVATMQPLVFAKNGTAVSFEFSPTVNGEILQVFFPSSLGPLQGQVQREGAAIGGLQKWAVKGVTPGKKIAAQFAVSRADLATIQLLETLD